MMRKLLFLIPAAFVVIGLASCEPERGCTDPTADNYDELAESDDGTCIPARDKLIGDYTYVSTWMGVLDSIEYINTGTFRLTESNLEYTEFVMNLDGELILHGQVSQDTLTFQDLVVQSMHQGAYPWEQTYSVNGAWLEGDTVDIRLNMTTQVPYLQGDPDPILQTAVQTYTFLGVKLNN